MDCTVTLYVWHKSLLLGLTFKHCWAGLGKILQIVYFLSSTCPGYRPTLGRYSFQAGVIYVEPLSVLVCLSSGFIIIVVICKF